jgi:hypothetical protein
MEGNGHGLVLGFLLDVRIYGVPTYIRIGYAPNRRQVPNPLGQLPRSDAFKCVSDKPGPSIFRREK